MRFSIDIVYHPDGRFEASSPEIGVAATADTLDEVFEKVKNLVIFHISNSEDAGLSEIDEEQVTKQLSLAFKDKNFCLPRHPKVH